MIPAAMSIAPSTVLQSTSLIRRRMKALGIEARHVILAVAPDGAGIIRSNIGPDGLGEMSVMLKEIADEAAGSTETDTKHRSAISRYAPTYMDRLPSM